MQVLKQWIEESGINCVPGALDLMQQHAEELELWNQSRGLTSIEPGEDTEIKHYLDSLLGLLVRTIDREERVLDLGSGGGFPGLPLKLCSGCHITLVDSNRHKVDYLHHVVRKLQLERIALIKARAEEIGRDVRHRGNYNLVVCRAVAPLPVLLELSLPLLERDGCLLAWKGPAVEEELEAGRRACRQLGGGDIKVTALELPEGYGERRLIQVNKVQDSPDRYPRRSGVPSKRPLGL